MEVAKREQHLLGEAGDSMMSQAAPYWLLEISKISVPVFLGALVWAGQTLAQRAWSEYERRRDAYVEVIQLIDSLFESDNAVMKAEDTKLYLRAIRKVWIIGSDEVITAGNALQKCIIDGSDSEKSGEKYRIFIEIMRKDARKRRWLSPGGTSLTEKDFPIQGAGKRRSE